MSVKNVRNYSFDILYNIFYNDKLLTNQINETIYSNDFNDEDISFIKKECTGVIENLENIDSIINKYSKVKTYKLKKDILIVFRMSIYEILYMDKVPEYATINESVNIIKNTKYKDLSGYVNATLKNIVKNETDNTIVKSDKIKYCYFKILNDYLDEVIDELTRLNINFYNYDGCLQFRYTHIYYTNKYKNILDTDSFKNGKIIIQDASSAYLVDCLYDYIQTNYKNNSKRIKILDTCSSPGGKIFSLYCLMKNNYNDCYFEARDISTEKINKIKENMLRLKINNINIKISDATKYNDEDFEKFDIVICDVPCSGIGVINKKPDIKLRINENKIKSLQKIQKSIIDVSKQYLKPRGILSYSTCTETKDENEDNILSFLKNNSNFNKIYEKRIESFDENKSDGFYMCIMKKD